MTQVLSTLAAAALGGAVGAAIRVGVVSYVMPGPWSIMALNVVGAFLLGLLLSALDGKGALLTVFLGGGVLGALTTFSTFAADIVRLANSQPFLAGVYLIGSISLAVLAFILGAQAGRFVS